MHKTEIDDLHYGNAFREQKKAAEMEMEMEQWKSRTWTDSY